MSISDPDHSALGSNRTSLRNIEFFQDIDNDTLNKLEQQMTRLALPAGRALFNEGDDSESLYVVVSGSLEIRNKDPQDNRPLVQIGAGEVVGELGVLTGEPRSASVWTVRDTELIMLSSDAFHRLLEDSPRSIATLARAIARRFVQEVVGNRNSRAKVSTLCVIPLSSDLPIKQCRDIISTACQREGTQLIVEADHRSRTSDWFHQLLLLMKPVRCAGPVIGFDNELGSLALAGCRNDITTLFDRQV